MDIYKRTKGEVEIIDLDAELRLGDLVWLETPINPTGESKYDTTCLVSCAILMSI